MALHTDVFVDACHYEGVCTGCSAVMGRKLPLTFVTEYFPNARGSTEAEILSAIAGLARVPIHRPVRLFTDMDLIYRSFHDIDFKVRRAHTREMIAALHEEADKHLSVEVELVKRSGSCYRQCHKRAGDMAHGIARLTLDPNLPMRDRQIVAEEIRLRMLVREAQLRRDRVFPYLPIKEPA